MNDSPADLAKWARDEAAEQVYTGLSDEQRGKLRTIADTLDYLTKERDRLHYLDSRTDLMYHYEEGDPEVGLWSTWLAYSAVTKQMMGLGGSLAELADGLRRSEVVEPQSPTDASQNGA